MSYNSSRYLVVEFLVLPYKDIDRCVCVPESWQRWRDPDGEVAIAYPEEKPEDTSVRALNNEDCSKRWKIYMANVCYKTDSYMDALHFIASLENNDLACKLQNMKTENSAYESPPKSKIIENKTKRNTPPTSTSTPITVKKETEEMIPSPTRQKFVKKDTEEITTPKIDKKKIEKNNPSTSSANANTNPSEETNNQDTGKEKKEVNITPQNKAKNSPYKIPVDFNPKDLKDMFRHTSPTLGEVVELLPNTGVFIEVNTLEIKYL